MYAKLVYKVILLLRKSVHFFPYKLTFTSPTFPHFRLFLLLSLFSITFSLITKGSSIPRSFSFFTIPHPQFPGKTNEKREWEKVSRQARKRRPLMSVGRKCYPHHPSVIISGPGGLSITPVYHAHHSCVHNRGGARDCTTTHQATPQYTDGSVAVSVEGVVELYM